MSSESQALSTFTDIPVLDTDLSHLFSSTDTPTRQDDHIRIDENDADEDDDNDDDDDNGHVPELLSVQPPREPSQGPLKTWLKRFTRNQTPSYHRHPERFVIGWPEDEALDPSYRMLCPGPPTSPQQRQQPPALTGPYDNRRDSNDADRASATSSSILRTVKTASFSGRSISLLSRSRSRPNTLLSAPHSSAAHSSGDDPSASDTRLSRLSATSSGGNRLSLRKSVSLDEGAFNRAIHRRQVIKEIFETEMTYLTGLKTLTDVISTFIVTRTTIHRSTLELVRTHERLLDKLREIQPSDSSNLASIPSSNWTAKARHSAGARFSRPDRKSLTSRNHLDPTETRLKSAKTVAAEPIEAARVAQILQSVLPSFAIYEDYMVTYQLILDEVDAMRKSTINWQVFDMGIEALIKSVAPHNRREGYSHQSFTLGDLLMKPIQRVCKYQLFLADLLKCTPVTDCPTSHFAIESGLQSVLETSENINRAAADPYIKDRIQKTLLLREVIAHSRHQQSGDVLREYGYLKVCGVLHVVYRTEDATMGEYMMCCLFNTHLILAHAVAEGKFAIVASIPLSNLRLEAADNSHGMVCEKPSFSWKIVFDHQGETYEFLMTACSDREAWEWKQQTLQHSTVEALHAEHDRKEESPRTSRLHLSLRPISTTRISLDGTLTRRTSVPLFDSQTIPKVGNVNGDIVRVLIKGTRAVPQDSHGNDFSIGRSVSMQQNHRQIVILAPRRMDRIRMEKWLSNIWTADVLPYPGMPTWRGERSIRSSATQLIRKISSNRLFSRRSSASTSSRSIDDHESVASSWRRSGEMDSWPGRLAPLSPLENGSNSRRSRPASPMPDHGVAAASAGADKSKLGAGSATPTTTAAAAAAAAATTDCLTLPFDCPRESDEYPRHKEKPKQQRHQQQQQQYQLHRTQSERVKPGKSNGKQGQGQGRYDGGGGSSSHKSKSKKRGKLGLKKTGWSSTFFKSIPVPHSHSHSRPEPGGVSMQV